MKNTDVGEFLTELEAGQLEAKLSAALSIAAVAAVDHNKNAEINLKLVIKPGGNGQPIVTVAHELKYKVPTKRGKKSEEDVGATPMHVGSGGKMSFFPEKQGQLFNNSESQRNTQ
jgi:hypothetical protein